MHAPPPLERQTVAPVRRRLSALLLASFATGGAGAFAISAYWVHRFDALDDAPAAAPAVAAACAPGQAVGDGLRLRRWQGVAVSREIPGVIAMWSEDEVLLSRDDGRSFAPVLGGGGPVQGAAVGGDGTLFALRDQLRVLHPDGTTRSTAWKEGERPLRGRVLQIDAGGGWVSLLGFRTADDDRPLLLASADGGRTFTARELPTWGNDHNELAVAPDGTVEYMGGSEASCGGGYQFHYRGHVDGREMKEVEWPLDAPGAFAIGGGGWTYATVACGERSPSDEELCAVGPDGEPRPVALRQSKDPPSGRLVVGRGAAATFAVWGERLLRLDGGRATSLAGAPAGISALTVDVEGRPVALAEGHVVRWSPAGGWRTLP